MALRIDVKNHDALDTNAPKFTLFGMDGGKLGRSSECELYLPCEEKSVSRVHAEIRLEDCAFLLIDRSINGVYINKSNEPLGMGKRHPIKHGDVFQIGNYELEANFDVEEDDIPAFAPSTNQANIVLDNNAVTTQPATSDIADARIDFGSTTDQFTPPTTIIPKDWDLDLASPELPAAKQEKAQVIDFSNKKSKLIESLLSGLAPESKFTADQITPETAQLLGKALRISLMGAVAQRRVLQEAKSKACLDEIPTERQMEADALGSFPNADSIIEALLDTRHRDQKKIPSLLSATLKYNLEDQIELNAGYQAAITKAQQCLAPAEIEKALEKAHKAHAQKNSAIESLSSKFMSQSKKWSFYTANWAKICEKASAQIGKDFETKTLLAHAKRMRDKNNATK